MLGCVCGSDLWYYRGESDHAVGSKSRTSTSVDIASRPSIQALVGTAHGHGDITGLLHAAGVSHQAPPATILHVDLYGTAVILEEFGNIIASGGSGVVIASQSGHRLGAPPQSRMPRWRPHPRGAARPADAATRTGHRLAAAYQSPNEATRCGSRPKRRGQAARINTISPGIIMTPLANDELTGPHGDGYRRMLELSPAGRAGTPDEVGTIGALLMGPDGAFIAGQRHPHGRRRHRLLLLRATPT